MKPVAYFSLAYIAGVHGFAIFAPYLTFFLSLAYVLKRVQKARRVKVSPITVPVEQSRR
jgi:hypothetical protein